MRAFSSLQVITLLMIPHGLPQGKRKQRLFSLLTTLAYAPMSFRPSGPVDRVGRTRFTCPAEAQVIGDIRQPFLDAFLLVLLTYRRSKTEWPTLSMTVEDPQCWPSTQRKSLVQIPNGSTTELLQVNSHYAVCLLTSGMEWGDQSNPNRENRLLPYLFNQD